MNRRSFLKGLAAFFAAPAAAPAVTEMIAHGFDAYTEPVIERFFYQSEFVEVSLGYAITRKAIDDNLYKNTFGDFPGAKYTEWFGHDGST